MGSGHFPPDLPRSALAWRGFCLTLVCTRTCCPTRWDRAGRETTGERHGKRFAADADEEWEATLCTPD